MRIISHKFRLKIFTRDGFVCAYCKKKFKFYELHVDHIYPKSKGGKDIPTNLITACAKCNLKKSDKVLKNPPVVKDLIIDLEDFTDQYASEYTVAIRITQETYDFLKNNYKQEGYRSMAHYLDVIIQEYINNHKPVKYVEPNPFKMSKSQFNKKK